MEGDNYGGSLKRRESGRDREGEQDWSIWRGIETKTGGLQIKNRALGCHGSLFLVTAQNKKERRSIQAYLSSLACALCFQY
jgi:hypothetical protein